jgi:CRP/FNR family transcriptional regulator
MLSRTDAFAAAPIFADLPRDRLEEVAAGARVHHLEAGDTLFRAGEPGTSVYVIQEGEVEVQIIGPRRRQLILAIAGPGASVGELSLLDEGPRSATVVATRETEALSIPREDLIRLLREDPEYMAAVLRLLASMIRSTNDRLAELAILDPPSRVAKVLLELADRDGVPVHRGTLIDRDVTHSEIAALTALYMAEVERVLRDLQLNDTIEKEGHRITILRRDALERTLEEL